MESVLKFQDENWNWPVFDILTTKGTIEPHSTGKIYVNFSPLEAREYKIQLQVNIVNGESQIIEICAAGFDPRKPPKEAVSDLDEFLTDGTRIVQTNLLCTLSAGLERFMSNFLTKISILTSIFFVDVHFDFGPLYRF